MLFGMRAGERFVQREVSLERPPCVYSAVFFTTDSTDVSIGFGLKPLQASSEEAKEKIGIAKNFLPASLETTRVVNYFCNIALESGFFVALPSDEIPEATGHEISRADLARAVEEGYLQIVDYPGLEIHLAEVTEKLAQLVNPDIGEVA